MSSVVKQAMAEKIREIADRVARSEGLEVLEAELLGGGSRRVVRIYIDKPGGVTHSDCELVSQQVGTILDIEDVIPGEGYTLEVSSPGVERKLYGPADYERFAGQKVKIALREPLEGQRRWDGKLTGIAGDTVSIETAQGKVLSIPLGLIDKANLKFEW